MNFFRLRLINTFLVLLIGVVLGYIMKERSGVKTTAEYTPKYSVSYAAPASPGGSEEPPAAEGVQAQEPFSAYADPVAGEKKGSAGETEPVQAPPDPARSRSEGTGRREPAAPVKGPAAQSADEAAPREDAPSAAEAPSDDAVRGSEEAFFKDPARFAGRELEMDLQMIMARKTQKGWLVNLVYARGGKNADYLYVEDDAVLGETPDLKIGYFYKVRFTCVKGDAAAGNKLLKLTPTANKAAWATGVSAIE